jgi:hypothetical protein
VLAVAQLGAQQGCTEALLTLGGFAVDAELVTVWRMAAAAAAVVAVAVAAFANALP